MPQAREPFRVHVDHPICSRPYAKQVGQADELGLGRRRLAMLAGLTGRVLEIGAGTGANLAHYPTGVTEVVAAEPEPHRRSLLTEESASATTDVEIADCAAELLPFPDASFDAAVASLVLCSVKDPRVALEELHRVVRPGGELRFMEHVASPTPWRARVQKTADACGWPLVSGGCHLGRATETLIAQAGFTIVTRETFGFRIPPLDPPKTHVLGRAVRRA